METGARQARQVDASDPRPGKEQGTKKTLGGTEPSRGHPDSSEQESCSLPTRQQRGLNVIEVDLAAVVGHPKSKELVRGVAIVPSKVRPACFPHPPRRRKSHFW